MKKYYIVFAILTSLNIISPSMASADDEGPELSFNKPDAYQVVNGSIELLTTWARGEYAEHEGEGLFARYPQDGAVISETINLVHELQQLAKKARSKGDETKARAYLFSAEATARYAAQMPHLLEDRINPKKNQ